MSLRFFYSNKKDVIILIKFYNDKRSRSAITIPYSKS